MASPHPLGTRRAAIRITIVCSSYLAIFAMASFSYLAGLSVIHLMSPRLEAVNLEVPTT